MIFMETTELEGYVSAIKEKYETPEEIGRFLQKLERDKFEYEEAKLVVANYEKLPNERMIEACEKILKEKDGQDNTKQ
jgi:hypothetical protein